MDVRPRHGEAVMKAHGRQRPLGVFVCAAVAATVAWSSTARAFELKHTSHGDLVRWASSQITFVVDPSLESVVGGGQGVADAIAAWSGAAGGAGAPPVPATAH